MAREHTQTCPVARVLNLIGDSWTLMIIREALYGATRFSDIQYNTGIAKNLLISRLNKLVENGIFEKIDAGDSGTRYEYHLTQKGRSLNSVMMAMHQWGNEYEFTPGEAPVLLIDKKTGKELLPIRPHRANGEAIPDEDISVELGPGASNATRKRFSQLS